MLPNASNPPIKAVAGEGDLYTITELRFFWNIASESERRYPPHEIPARRSFEKGLLHCNEALPESISSVARGVQGRV